MYLKKSIAGGLLLLAVVLTLSACSSANAAQTTPTVDPNMIYTAAAKTVQAQLTKESLAKPTETQTPTETLSAPTADMSLPTLAGPSSQDTPVPGATAPIAPSLTPLATQVGAKPPTAPKSFQWVANDPPDGTTIIAGTKFDIAWKVKNVGTTPWTTGYTYGYFSGDKYFEHTKYNLKASVPPGGEVSVLVDAVAPSASGTYYTWWKMINDQGQNIGDMDLKIVVVQPGETPKAPTATATP
jgi:hypothetical protein